MRGRERDPTPSIRGRLTALAVFSIVPVALLVVAVIWSGYRQGRDALLQSTLGTTRALSALVDRQIGEVQAGVAALATSPALAQRDLRRFHAQAVNFLNGQTFAGNIVVIDASGRQVANTARPFGSELPAGHEPPQLLSVFAQGRPVVTDLFSGPLRGVPLVAVGVPAFVDAKVAYAVNAGIPPGALRAVLLAQQLPPDWVVSILDRRGRIVARTREHHRFVGERASDELAARTAAALEGSFEGVTKEGIPVVAMFSRAPTSGWTVVIGVPQSGLLKPLRGSLLMLALGTLAVLAGAVSAAWFLAGRITRSVKHLTAASVSLGRGATVTLPRLDFREANALGAALLQARSDLLQAHAELSHNEARLRTILESAPDAMMVTGEAGRIVVFNAAACRRFGYAREAAMGMDVRLLLPQRQRARFDEVLQAARETGSAALVAQPPAEAPLGLRSDETEFPIEASISVTSAEGETFFTLIVHDISARVQLQRELLRSNTDLQQFAFVAAHDLRSPLRSVHGYLELVERRLQGGAYEAAGDLIARAKRGVVQMNRLTEDLLSYARIDQRAKPLAPVDLDALLADVVGLLQPLLVEAAAVVEAEPLPTVLGDSTQLAQLFQNLLINAVNYRSDQPPRVKLFAAEQGDWWLIGVRDNGVGIDEKYHQKVFEVFKRLHTEREVAGSGIGLSICRRVVERHGGRIWVESQAGSGATFFFTLRRMPRENEGVTTASS